MVTCAGAVKDRIRRNLMTLNIQEYPLASGSWTCSECGKKKLRHAFPCDVCFGVLCDKCAEHDHRKPMTGGWCGENDSIMDQMTGDADG